MEVRKREREKRGGHQRDASGKLREEVKKGKKEMERRSGYNVSSIQDKTNFPRKKKQKQNYANLAYGIVREEKGRNKADCGKKDHERRNK